MVLTVGSLVHEDILIKVLHCREVLALREVLAKAKPRLPTGPGHVVAVHVCSAHIHRVTRLSVISCLNGHKIYTEE